MSIIHKSELTLSYNIKTRYWIIRYVCVPRFHFLSYSLLFTQKPGHYMPKSPCSSPYVLLFTPKFSSRYVPVFAVSSVRCGGLGVFHTWSAFSETSERGVFEWVRSRKCAQNYLGARNLLRQVQSQPRISAWLLGL